MSHNFNHLRGVTGSQASISVVSEEGECHVPRSTQPVSLLPILRAGMLSLALMPNPRGILSKSLNSPKKGENKSKITRTFPCLLPSNAQN